MIKQNCNTGNLINAYSNTGISDSVFPSLTSGNSNSVFRKIALIKKH